MDETLWERNWGLHKSFILGVAALSSDLQPALPDVLGYRFQLGQPPQLRTPISCNKCLNIHLLLGLLPGGALTQDPNNQMICKYSSIIKKLISNKDFNPAELCRYLETNLAFFLTSWFLKSFWNSYTYIQILEGEKAFAFKTFFKGQLLLTK